MTGTCKWFNSEKGYGFITGQDGKDYFCHHTSIDMKGYRTLDEGDRVDFVVEMGAKGPVATSVRKI